MHRLRTNAVTVADAEEAVEEVEAGAEAGELLEVALPSFTEAEAAIVAEAATTTITIT